MCAQAVGRGNINGPSAGLPTHLRMLHSRLNFICTVFFLPLPTIPTALCTVSSSAEDGEFFNTHVIHLCYAILILTEIISFPSSFLKVPVSGDVVFQSTGAAQWKVKHRMR